MVDKERKTQAYELFHKAYRSQIDGHIEPAIEDYKKSIEIYPTAKAHTFLGWAYSLINRFEDAIEHCKYAIELDPDFGNPYNDIGSYLITLKQYEEALFWLERALDAKNYDHRYYPLYNIGRVYEKKGEWFTAIHFYQDALEIKPDYEAAKEEIIRLQSMMN